MLPISEAKEKKVKKEKKGPGWCGSVDSALACEPKGHHFASQIRAHAWVTGQAPCLGVCMTGNHTLMFHCPSLPPLSSV